VCVYIMSPPAVPSCRNSRRRSLERPSTTTSFRVDCANGKGSSLVIRFPGGEEPTAADTRMYMRRVQEKMRFTLH
jgi:hypothetical protein